MIYIANQCLTSALFQIGERCFARRLPHSKGNLFARVQVNSRWHKQRCSYPYEMQTQLYISCNKGGSLNLSKWYSKPCIAKFDTSKLTAIERRPVERTEILHPCRVCALEGEIMGLHSLPLPLPRSRRNCAKKAKDLQHIPRPNLAAVKAPWFPKHVKRHQTHTDSYNTHTTTTKYYNAR